MLMDLFVAEHGISQFSKDCGLQLIVDQEGFLSWVDINAASFDTLLQELGIFSLHCYPLRSPWEV